MTAAVNPLATPSPCNESLEQWIDRSFSYHGAAIRREDEPATPGEPFMSMATAMDLVRRAVKDFTPASTDGEWVPAAKLREWQEQINGLNAMLSRSVKLNDEILSAIQSLSPAPANLILSLSSRVEKAEAALKEIDAAIGNYRPFPNQEGSVFRNMYEKIAKPELLDIIRNLIPGEKP